MEEIGFATPSLRFGALVWNPPAPAGAPLALCLHGYPDTAWTWRFLGPRLAADGWRIVAPFMRGYAPTELAPDGDYSIAALARDAIACHEALGGDERAVLIGHDWGAAAMYAAAALAPERFSRVVGMAVPPGPALLGSLRASPLLAVRQARHSWYMAFQQLPVLSEASLDWLIPRLWRWWSPAYEAGEDVSRVLAALDGTGRRTAALSYYRALRRLRPRDLSGAPPQPLLYLHGRQDGCMLASLVDRERFPPGARVELIDGAGHFLALEQPERVGELVAEFLESSAG